MGQIFVGDFETTTREEDCRVWGWGLYDLVTKNVWVNNHINSFFDKVFLLTGKTATVYFHNLKFDGEFILYWLFENGYTHTTGKALDPGYFQTLITHMGVFYQIKFKSHTGKTITILDSLKILPMPVSAIPGAFGLDTLKGDIDYTLDRPPGWEITLEEHDYIANDVRIVGEALEIIRGQGMVKMTAASNALADFKHMYDKKRFEYTFPVLEMDSWLRKSYKGGYTYCNPKYQGKEIGEGKVYDVNSLYPWVMHEKLLPYGDPVYFEGEYQRDDRYPLYIVSLTCVFELKAGHLPTIQLKNNSRFVETEYLTSSEGEEVFLVMTSIDLQLMKEHYNLYNVEYIEGWKFKASDTIFKEYVDKWMEIKIEADASGNKAMRTLAKLMQNSLYGKFGLNPRVQSKKPTFDGEMIHYITLDPDSRKPIYVPMASFITAYAREKTIRTAQSVYDRFLYADTDSLHLWGSQTPDIEVDKYKLGAWKHEYDFTRGKFIRAKTYVEEVEGDLHVTCAGMPKSSHEYVTFENFEKGLKVYGKLRHKRVKGGVILQEEEFTIKLD